VERLLAVIDGRQDVGIALDLGPGATPRRLAEGQAQIAHALGETIQVRRQLGQVPGLAQVLVLRIPAQFEQLTRADRRTEKTAGHVRQLMGLVDHVGIGSRQELAEAVVTDRKIGAQQVMVDDHHIRLLGAPTGLDQVAAAPRVAFLAQAVVGGRRDQGPDRRVFRDVDEFGDVTRARALRPVPYLEEPAQALCGMPTPILQGGLQPMNTQVVRTPLEQGDPGRTGHRFAQTRQIAQEQLVLQVARSGRDDHFTAGQQRRHQVGEGLARAGARLGDQLPASLQRGRNPLRHLELLASLGEAFEGPGQQTLRPQNVTNIHWAERPGPGYSARFSQISSCRPLTRSQTSRPMILKRATDIAPRFARLLLEAST
jgi:hypothetical protein